MKREDMEQIKAIRRELEDLQRRLETAPSTLQTIWFKDYRTGKGIPKALAGYDGGDEERARIMRSINKKQRQGLKAIAEAEEWLEAIEDPTTRLIARMYYFDGRKQKEIAEELGYSRSGIAMRLERIWKEEESC